MPDSVRERSAVAAPGAAVVYPVVVWPVRILALLVVAASAVALSIQIRDRRILRAYERERVPTVVPVDGSHHGRLRRACVQSAMRCTTDTTNTGQRHHSSPR